MSHTVRVGAHIQLNDPYWVEMREAIYKRAQELGMDLIPIDTDLSALSHDAQADIIEELLGLDLHALIGWDLAPDLIWRFLDAGLPIVHLHDRAIRHPHFVSPTDLYDVGQMVGAYIAEQLNGQGTVLVIGGLAGQSEDGACRLSGVYQSLQAQPGMRICHIPCAWRYQQAYDQCIAAMPLLDVPIDAIFGLSDSVALAGRDAGQALGRCGPETLIVGINGDPMALAAIAAGQMTATVDTATSEIGRRIAELAFQAGQGLDLPETFCCARLLVTAQNVGEVAARKLMALADLPNRLVGVNRQVEQQRLRQLETTLAINRRIGAILDRRQLSHEIANLIRANYGYDFVQLWLWSELEQELVLNQPDRPTDVRRPIRLAQAGVLGQAVIRNEIIFIPNTQRSNRFAPDPAWPDTQSRVVLPIRLGDSLLGLLDLHSRQPTRHTRDELTGLQILADQLGIAMHNAELYSSAVVARARAEQADQLKTRLLANVNHELRTPLNVILGYTQSAIAATADAGEPSLSHDLRQIYHSGEHLQRLINDLLDLSRAEIDELDLFSETIDTAQFLQAVFRDIADGIARPNTAVDWQLAIPARLPLLQADPVRVRQILLNLLSNAQKFTQQGQICLGAEVAPPYLHIWVADTGSGIPADLQERIFEPFVTQELDGRRPEGIGLGLCITQRLVVLHRGAITLESQPGQGSTFHVYLPLPNLSGAATSLRPPDQPYLLAISAAGAPAAAISEIGGQLGLPIYRVGQLAELAGLLGQGAPAAIAWDSSSASPADWALIEQIRCQPALGQVPCIIYGMPRRRAPGMSQGPAGLFGSLPPNRTLLETIEAQRMATQPGPIAIVDDDPQAREIYRRVAAEALPNCSIHTLAGGTAALEFLEQQTPSLMILDLSMPDTDGFTVLERLRERTRTHQVPVLVISGRSLSAADLKRLDHPRVTLHCKDIIAQGEAAAALRRSLAGTDLLPPQTSALVRRAAAYLQQNHTRAIARQEVADAVGVSKNYLSQIFHQELGISPWEYLNRYRVMRSRTLLCTTSESISAIATQVGFDDASYFGRVFHKHTGQSPRQYREQLAVPAVLP